MPRASAPDGLTDKQRRFVVQYLVDLNGTKAAIRAGYSPKTAYTMATENLTKPHVRAAVDKALALQAEATKLTRDRVVAQIDKLLGEAVDRSNHAAAARHAELLAKLNGWIVEKRDVRVVRSVSDLSDDELAALADEGVPTTARH